MVAVSLKKNVVKSVAWARHCAKDYKLKSYPAKQDFLTELLNTRTDRYIHGQLQETFGEYYQGFEWLRHVEQSDRLQARLPFNMRIQ